MSANERFVRDLAALSARAPGIKSVTHDSAQQQLLITTTSPPPFQDVVVQLSASYGNLYPYGGLSFMIADVFRTVGATESMDLMSLCCAIYTCCETLNSHPEAALWQESTARGGMSEMSWSQQSTCEFGTPPTVCGGGSESGGFYPGMNSKLLEDIQRSPAGLPIHVVDHPSIGLTTISLNVPLTALRPHTAAAWEVIATEPMKVVLTFDRHRYLDAAVKVEAGQERNFTRGVFNGLPSQCRNMVDRCMKSFSPQNVLKRPLLAEGYLADDIHISDDGEQVIVRPDASWQGKDLRAFLGGTTFSFEALYQHIVRRIPHASSYCAICDRFQAGGERFCISVCDRPACTFQLTELAFDMSFGFAAALNSGVVDLLFNFAKWAALSNRAHLILDPFPNVFDGSGTCVVSSGNKNAASIEVVRQIFLSMPPSFELLRTNFRAALLEAHPLAYSLTQWIISSNRSYLVKLKPLQRIHFIPTVHQYLLFMADTARQDRFDELRKKYGSSWAFHGSSSENWHSILRNGLRNASGTALQVNGNAYGNGIYMSPDSSVSFGYSQGNLYQTVAATAAAAAATPPDDTFIDFSSMRCLALCEVANTPNMTRNSNIWVQPSEDAVMARFFVVYKSTDTIPNVNLTDPQHMQCLTTIVETSAPRHHMF